MAGDNKILFESIEQRLKDTDWESVRSPFPSQVPELVPELYDDLEALAKADFEMAVDLWDKYVPNNMARPATIDRAYKEQQAGIRAISEAFKAAVNDSDEQKPKRFRIPEENLPQFKSTMERINRRAKKLGFSPITYKEIDQEVATAEAIGEGGVRKVMTYIHTMEVQGEQPVLSGWRFLGKLEHLNLQGDNLVMGSVPVEYRSCKPNCDHCNKLRARNETFILQNIESSDIMQVGRSCLTDFFNGDNPMNCASYLQLIFDLEEQLGELDEENFRLGAGSREYVTAEQVLSLAAAHIDDYGGWVSKEKGELENLVPSAQLIRLMLSGTEEKVEVKESHIDKAREVLAWLMSEEQQARMAESEYMHNLAIMAKADTVPMKKSGLFASAIVAYDRYMRDKEVSAAAALSDHVGAVDGKIDSYSVTVIGKVLIPGGQWGDKMLYRFRDDDSNLLVWFSTGKDIAEVGDRLHINGTVSEHGVYRDAKQTTLLRVTSNESKLCEAVRNGKDAAAIKKLLKKPVNLDHLAVHDRRSPLMYAAQRGHADVVRVLLDAGANPDKCDAEASTAAFFAAYGGWQQCLDVLNEYGADTMIVNRAGKTFADVQAEAQQHLSRDASRYQERCDDEKGRCDATVAVWRQEKAFDLSKIAGTREEWADWFTSESAKAEEAGQSHIVNSIADGHYDYEPLTLLERDGKTYVWDGKKRVGAAMRGGRNTLPAIIGTYSPELVVNHIKELRERIDAAKESYADRLTQYQSETALYGEAGPGQHPSLYPLRIAEEETQLAALLNTPEGKALLEQEHREAQEWVASSAANVL